VCNCHQISWLTLLAIANIPRSLPRPAPKMGAHGFSHTHTHYTRPPGTYDTSKRQHDDTGNSGNSGNTTPGVRTDSMCLLTGTESNTFHASAGRYILVCTDLLYRTGLLLHTLFPYPSRGRLKPKQASGLVYNIQHKYSLPSSGRLASSRRYLFEDRCCGTF
jgi:hypothetical protein